MLLILGPAMVGVGHTNAFMDWVGTSGGFGSTAGGNNKLMTDIGQQFIGRSAAANTVVESGFLAHPFLRGTLVGVPEQEGLPATYDLLQNYPNPFNPSTTITYALPRQSHVLLVVYNILGQEVTRLVDETQDAGVKSVLWHTRSNASMPVASGVYFYRIDASPSEGKDRFVQVKKLMVLK
jgi:hypothetical protein